MQTVHTVGEVCECKQTIRCDNEDIPQLPIELFPFSLLLLCEQALLAQLL